MNVRELEAGAIGAALTLVAVLIAYGTKVALTHAGENVNSKVGEPGRADTSAAHRNNQRSWRVVHAVHVMRLAVLAAAAVLLVSAWRLGVFSLLADPPHVKALLLESGSLGFVVFIATFAFVQPIAPLPGRMFTIAASLVWPAPVAMA